MEYTKRQPIYQTVPLEGIQYDNHLSRLITVGSFTIYCIHLFDLFYNKFVIEFVPFRNGITRCLRLYEVRKYRVSDTLCLLAFLFAANAAR